MYEALYRNLHGNLGKSWKYYGIIENYANHGKYQTIITNQQEINEI